MPYAGYVHLIPRLIACTTAWLPWEYLPFCYAVAAGSITTAVLTRGAFAGMLLIVRIAAAVGMVAQPRPKRSRNHGSAMGTTVDRSARLPAAIRLPVPAGEFRERAMALARQPCVGRHGFSLTLIFALRQENCGSVPAVEKTEPFLLLVRGQNPSS